MDPDKCSYYINGCQSDFVSVDGKVYAPHTIIDERTGDFVTISDHDGSFWGCEMVGPQRNIERQEIWLPIPKNIFAPDMEYVCVKQLSDTALEIVKEDDLQPGDTAVRILIPHKYFQNQLKRRKLADYNEGVDIEYRIDDFAEVELFLYVGIGLYIANR